MTTVGKEYNFISDEEINRRISNNIRKYRILAGITQEQLAEDIKKSYDFVRKLEFTNGKKSCSKITLYKISIVLNTSIEKFFE